MQTTYKHIASRLLLRTFLMQGVVLTALMIVVVSGVLTATFAHAADYCNSGDATYLVRGGDTLGLIAWRYHTTYQQLASYNHIPNPNLIYIAQHLCIPHTQASHPAPIPVSLPVSVTQANTPRGTGNVFSYPACTWWASQRYYQLHGYYVPWTTNSNAWEWTARAYQFGWHVSFTPHVGTIVDLQPYVQGAYYLGHVGVVERVLGNGSFVASNTSWGMYPYAVSYVTMHTGYGVTFLG